MNEGWVKIHRKLINSEVWQDPTACRIFIWLLLKVKYETGKIRLGRKWASKACNLNENTFYKALLRLQNNYKIVNLVTGKVTIRYTEASIINWHKYQHDTKLSTNQVTHNKNSKKTTKNTTKKTTQNISKPYITNILHDSSNRAKCSNPLGHANCLENINSVQREFQKHFTNYSKQINALHKIYLAGFSDEEVEDCLNEVDRDEFWQEKGWDLMDIANILAKGGKKYVLQKKEL